ncbi:MAG: WD40 repeat domain-containing protein [Candidatus Poribacteria bacterium]|nr:WD40 repeat domain-containing protein [Candidatus Poribacteria bacterium]
MYRKSSIVIFIFLCLILITTTYAQDNTQVGLPEGAIARLGKGSISLMQFSPDGTRLAVGTSIGVWLYDVKTGNTKTLISSKTRQINKKIKNIYGEHDWIGDSVSYVNCLAFSPDNLILAVSEMDNYAVQLWDLETGMEKSTLPATHPRNKAYAMAFSEDSKTLIAPHYYGEIIHWDVATGSREVFLNKSPSHSFDKLAITDDRKTFVSGDLKDGEIRLWDAYTGRQLTLFEAKTPFSGIPQHIPKPQKGVNVLALSPDGKTVASAHDDNSVRLWDIASSTETFTFFGHKERVNSIAFSPDSKILVSGSNDETIIFWDVNKKQKLITLSGHDGSVQAVTFSPNGEILASGSTDGTIRFWDVKTKQETSIFASGHTVDIISVAFTEHDKMLATAAENGTVEIWDLKTRKLLPKPSIAYHDKTEASAFSQDARMYVSHGSDTTVRSNEGGISTSWLRKRETRLWVLPTGDEILTIQENAESFAFSPDNKLLAAYIDSSNQKGIRILETATLKELLFINKRIPFSRSLLFSPNSKLLALYGTHTKTMVWDVTTQTEITPPEIKHATGIAFSPDSTMLANGNHEGIVLWNITPTGMQELGPIENSRRVFSKGLIFSPDGKTFIDSASGRNDVIHLWDVDTGSDLGTLYGHAGPIKTLQFSHDGKTLASGSRDGTVLLWDWEAIITKARKTKEVKR